MASSNGSITTGAYGSNQRSLTFNWWINSQDIGSNTTQIGWNIVGSGGATNNYTYSGPFNVVIDGSQVYYSGTRIKLWNGTQVASGTFNLGHNNAGNRGFGVYIECAIGSTSINESASGSWDLPTIPRYANITSFSVSQRDETSVQYNWSADSSCDYAWYSTDNGNSWNGLPSNNIVGGLSPNSNYNFKLRVKRTDSQLTTDSGTYNQSTFDYPKPTSINNFTIGDGALVNLYNPLGRNCTLELISNVTGGVIGTYIGTYNGQVNGEFKTTDAINKQYASIPNAKSGTYYAKVTYGSSVKTLGNGTYSVKGTEIPTFASSNWSYTADYTNLTNNNQTIINNYSTITIKVDTNATGNNSATINKYVFTWGTKSVTLTDTSSSVTIVGGSGNIISASVVDSRGLTTSANKTIGDFNYVQFILPTISANAKRDDGVKEDTKLDATINLFSNKFGNDGIYDTLSSISYAISSDGTTYSTNYPISLNNFTITNNTSYSLNDYQIYSNGTSIGFTIGAKYYVKLIATDILGNAQIVTIVTSGEFARDVFKDSNGYHEGVNGLADANFAQSINGSLDVTKNIRSNGGYIDMYNGSVTDFNLALTEGHYYVSNTDSIPNAPHTGGIYGYLEVKVNDSNSWNKVNNWIWQELIETNGDEWCRRGVNNSPLTSWIKKTLIPYPVGAIYQSTVSTSPSTLFGGTWVQLTDRFLIGAGGTYANGSTGGETNHTLTVAELASHHHSFGTYNGGGGGFIGYDTSPDTLIQRDTTDTGGNQAHNNMPPYRSVYMWYRSV